MTRTEFLPALPLFPLRSVLFPGGVLPLKIFEPRYLDLISRCMRRQESFGVVCLVEGIEVGPDAVRFERLGTLARIDEVDAEQAGILQVRCTGQERFELVGEPQRSPQGLWSADVRLLPADERVAPRADLVRAVDALDSLARAWHEQGLPIVTTPVPRDDAGWIANRWCELLPLPLAEKQSLLAMDDPQERLRQVEARLRAQAGRSD